MPSIWKVGARIIEETTSDAIVQRNGADMSQYFLCGEQDEQRIVDSIRNAATAGDLRNALNDALAHIDMQQDDTVEDALCNALEDH
jgi:hypothetical protein